MPLREIDEYIETAAPWHLPWNDWYDPFGPTTWRNPFPGPLLDFPAIPVGWGGPPLRLPTVESDPETEQVPEVRDELPGTLPVPVLVEAPWSPPVQTGEYLPAERVIIEEEPEEAPVFEEWWPEAWREGTGIDYDEILVEYPTETDVVLSMPAETVPEEESEVAIDWGDIVGGVLGDIATGIMQPAGGPLPFYTGPTSPGMGGGIAPPTTVTVDTRTGKVTRCKRRRRRRLLTPTDLSDLAALAAVVGKGDALKLAVAKAVRR